MRSDGDAVGGTVHVLLVGTVVHQPLVVVGGLAMRLAQMLDLTPFKKKTILQRISIAFLKNF